MNIVKILENPDVENLTEAAISSYRQTVDTVESLEKAIVDPFNTLAKEREEKQVHKQDGLEISLNTTTSPSTYTAKNVLDLLKGTLYTAQVHNGNGKQMYGVRRFDDIVAMDVAYLGDCVTTWEAMQIGESASLKITYKGAAVKTIAEQTREQLVELPQVTDITESTAKLYIAAKEQTKKLKSKIITPFEQAFKAQADKDKEATTFHRTPYGGLQVQVKSVPREEPNYVGTLERTKRMLTAYASIRQDFTGVHMNWDLQDPRPYVEAHVLEGKLERNLQHKDVKFRQEVSILYRPHKAFVMVE